MTWKHDTGIYNVEASLVAWLVAQITTNTPPLVSTIRVNLSMPERPLNPPEWSIHFLGYGSDEGGLEGKRPGVWRYGIAEVNCWVTRADTNWRGQLNQMVDAVTEAVAGEHSVIIRDFYTSDSAPAATNYRMTLTRAELRWPPTDPNPDIERRRILIYFQWVERG